MKTAVKHCVSSAYQIGTGGGVEGRRGLAPPPIRFRKTSGFDFAVDRVDCVCKARLDRAAL